MANQTEMKTNLFEELTDEELATVVGGTTSTTDEAGGLLERGISGVGTLLITTAPFGTTGRIVGNTVKGIDD